MLWKTRGLELAGVQFTAAGRLTLRATMEPHHPNCR